MTEAAPVAAFELHVAGDRIVGYAAPARGRLACALALEADGETIAIGRATRFSAVAATREIRFGWCGVMLPGLHAAAALADGFVVRCLASGAVVLEDETPAPPHHPPAPCPLSVEAILSHVREADCCDDPAAILPFVEATLRRDGMPTMLDLAYRTLLGRAADEAIVAAWKAHPPDDAARTVLAMIAHAREYRQSGRMAPGPFHPAFAFDPAPLDG